MKVEHLTDALLQGTSLILLVMLCGEVIVQTGMMTWQAIKGAGQEVTGRLERDRE